MASAATGESSLRPTAMMYRNLAAMSVEALLGTVVWDSLPPYARPEIEPMAETACSRTGGEEDEIDEERIDLGPHLRDALLLELPLNLSDERVALLVDREVRILGGSAPRSHSEAAAVVTEDRPPRNPGEVVAGAVRRIEPKVPRRRAVVEDVPHRNPDVLTEELRHHLREPGAQGEDVRPARGTRKIDAARSGRGSTSSGPARK